MKDCIALEIASVLIDGGWVSSDRAEIKQYYELTDQEALEIVNAMADLENDPYRQEDRLRNQYH